MPANHLVVLTGPPGAGKTTVADILVQAAPFGVHVHGDDFWHYIKAGPVAPWLPGAERQNEVVTSAVGVAAAEYAAGGYLTILDTVIRPWLLQQAVAPARTRGLSVAYVILRPTLDVALRRTAARGHGLRDEDAVRTVHDAFTELGEFERYVLGLIGHAA